MYEVAKNLALSARECGWRLLVVGGFVRDQVRGVSSKDVDCEVYGADSVDSLIEWLSGFGKVNAVGRSFGVLKPTVNGVDLDVSLPRRENKVGQGHKGFIVEPDPSMTPRCAAARRDFTWNAMAYDPITNQVLDFFGGQTDLKAGILRHTSEAFAEDPLRVLRGFQFCGRFDLRADNHTALLCADLADEYPTLAQERIWTEWEKWARKSVTPSCGLDFLRVTGWIEKYPALFALIDCEQEPAHHPEGDAFAHTMHTVDAMSRICDREGIEGEDRVVLVLAALLHDVGKPETSEYNEEKGRITSYNHPKAGDPIARQFLESVGAPKSIIDRVLPLVREHMRNVNYFTGGTVNERTVRRLARDLDVATIQEWVYVVEADHSGRPPLSGGLPVAATEIVGMAEKLAVKDATPKPILMGRHLIEMGMTPGPEFGVILSKAFDAQIDGEFASVDEGIEWLS